MINAEQLFLDGVTLYNKELFCLALIIALVLKFFWMDDLTNEET